MSTIVNELITIDDKNMPIFAPIAKTLEPFKQVIVNSRTKGGSYEEGQRIATKRLAYVYFMCHYNSNFVLQFEKESERAKHVKKFLGLEDWNETQDIKDAKNFFNEYFQYSLSLDIVINARSALMKTREWFKTFDPKKESITELIKITKDLGAALNGIDELELRVKKELSSSSRIKGGGGTNDFEEPKRHKSTEVSPYDKIVFK